MYLQPDIVGDIRESFEDNSEIELKDFLLVGRSVLSTVLILSTS